MTDNHHRPAASSSNPSSTTTTTTSPSRPLGHHQNIQDPRDATLYDEIKKDLIQDHHTLVDVPKIEIENLPLYYQRGVQNRTSVLVTGAAASNKAVADIRAELARAKQLQQETQQEQHGTDLDSHLNSVQFIGFALTRTHPRNQKRKERPPALLQLATATTAYLFRLRYDGMSEHDSPMTRNLRCLLSDRQIIKVVFSAFPVQNVSRLNLEYGNDCCGEGESFLGLLPLARYRWPKLRRCGLRNITATVLRCQLHSEMQFRNCLFVDWERIKMTQSMEEFAASKAFVVLDLLDAIRKFPVHAAVRVFEEQQLRDQTIIAPAEPVVVFECTREMQGYCARHDEQPIRDIATSSTASACVIDAIEAEIIKQLASREEKHGREEVSDIPDDAIQTLAPYQRTEHRKIIVVTGAAGSDKAVTDIRTELLQTHDQTSGERNLVFNSYRFIAFRILNLPQKDTPVLLQIATISTAYLFRLHYLDMPEINNPMTDSLRCLLSDLSILKIGIAHQGDVRTLNRVYGNDCCGDGASFLNLRPFINLRWPGITTFGIRNIAAVALGYRLHAKQKPGLWRYSQTTPAMEERAGADAFVVLDLFAALLNPRTPPVRNVVSPAAAQCLMDHQPSEHTRSDSGSAAQVRKMLMRYSSDIRDYKVIDFPKHEIVRTLPRYSRPEHRQIVVITCASASDQAVSDIRLELSLARPQHNEDDANSISKSFQFVGFDTETKPSFKKGSIGNPPALLQIATFTTAYLFRLKWDGMDEEDSPMTESLQCLLSDPSIIKVGSGIHDDFTALNRRYGAKFCGDGSSYFELSPLARNRWPMLERCGLRSLTATVLRHNLSKGQQTANWEKETMSCPMREYAAADAFVALDLLALIVLKFDGYTITNQAKDEAWRPQMTEGTLWPEM